GCVYHCAFRAAPDHLVEARDGQSGQAYRHLIPRAYIQFFPALQRAESDAADPAFIEVDRLQAQDRRDAPRTADAEIHRLDHGQCLAGWVLPGDCPVWRFGLPAFAGRARALAQHHAIAGERLRFGEPALAPLARLRRVLQRLGIAQAVAEAEPVQDLQALRHLRRAVRPVPDEQADFASLLLVQGLSRHQAGHLAPCAGTAVTALHVIVQVPVKLALQHGIERLRQACRYPWQLPGTGRPVLPVAPVSATDGLLQNAGAVD